MNTKNLKKLASSTFEYFSQDKASSHEMYVKNNPYAQASNQYVFVKKDSELDATNCNLYRTNDGQLLHTNTVFGANKSLDIFSFFQEASVNNYKYNYASSPEGNVATSITVNTTFEIEPQLRVTALIATTTSTVLESNPYDGTAYSFDSSNYPNYKFLVKNSCGN